MMTQAIFITQALLDTSAWSFRGDFCADMIRPTAKERVQEMSQLAHRRLTQDSVKKRHRTNTVKQLALSLSPFLSNIIELWHVISNNVVGATSKGSDQPAHRRSLIRAFASRLNIL